MLYELSYDQVQVAEQGGTQVLTLTKGSTVTKIPVYDLPGILAAKGCPPPSSPHPGQAALLLRCVPQDWFALWVDIAYNVGLTSGVGKNRYAPNQTLTVAEALKLAATIESRYQGTTFI